MKFVSLMSSGIDSPVATYLLSKKANEIILVHTDNRPFTDDREIEKVLGEDSPDGAVNRALSLIK